MKPISTLKNTLLLSIFLILPSLSNADSAAEIDAKANEALNNLYSESSAAKELGEKAKGLLIFPLITKAGVGVGGEFGEGVLRSGEETVAYYNSVSASIGLQLGVSQRSQIIMFLEQEALDNFSAASGWEAGVDANIAVLELGGTAKGTTTNIKDPIIAFIFGEKGLMAGISLEGAKYTKIEK